MLVFDTRIDVCLLLGFDIIIATQKSITQKKIDSVSDFGRMNLRERSATRFYRQGCFVNKINGDYSFVQSNCVYLFTCPNMDAVRYKG